MKKLVIIILTKILEKMTNKKTLIVGEGIMIKKKVDADETAENATNVDGQSNESSTNSATEEAVNAFKNAEGSEDQGQEKDAEEPENGAKEDNVKSEKVSKKKLEKGDDVMFTKGASTLPGKVQHVNIDKSIDVMLESGERVNDVFVKGSKRAGESFYFEA